MAEEITAAQESSAVHSDGPDYTVHTVLDRGGLEACMRFLIPGWYAYLFFFLGAALIAVSATLAAVYNSVPIAIVSMIVGLFCIRKCMRLRKNTVESQLSGLKEKFGTDAVKTDFLFWPQGIVIMNQESDKSVHFRYETIRELAVNRGYLTIKTVNRRAAILRLSDLDLPGDFIRYLKGKCPTAKFTEVPNEQDRI